MHHASWHSYYYRGSTEREGEQGNWHRKKISIVVLTNKINNHIGYDGGAQTVISECALPEPRYETCRLQAYIHREEEQHTHARTGAAKLV